MTFFLIRIYFFFNVPPPTQIYTLSLHDALPISLRLTSNRHFPNRMWSGNRKRCCLPENEPKHEDPADIAATSLRSEEHTSELQSRGHLVCRLLLEKKKPNKLNTRTSG